MAAVTERDMMELLHRRYSATTQGTTSRRYVCAEHVRSDLGFDRQSADFYAQDCWAGSPSEPRAFLHGHEIKVSRADWLRELRKPNKAEAFRPFCHAWWLVVPDPELVKPGELPPTWGLLAPRRDGKLWAFKAAPLINPQPMTRMQWAAFLRATQATAARRAAAEIRAVVEDAMVFLDDDTQYTDPDGTLDRVWEVLNR